MCDQQGWDLALVNTVIAELALLAQQQGKVRHFLNKIFSSKIITSYVLIWFFPKFSIIGLNVWQKTFLIKQSHYVVCGHWSWSGTSSVQWNPLTWGILIIRLSSSSNIIKWYSTRLKNVITFFWLVWTSLRDYEPQFSSLWLCNWFLCILCRLPLHQGVHCVNDKCVEEDL